MSELQWLNDAFYQKQRASLLMKNYVMRRAKIDGLQDDICFCNNWTAGYIEFRPRDDTKNDLAFSVRITSPEPDPYPPSPGPVRLAVYLRMHVKDRPDGYSWPGEVLIAETFSDRTSRLSVEKLVYAAIREKTLLRRI